MTVRELREAIANLPDEGEVYVERVEDKYFDNGWTVIEKSGYEGTETISPYLVYC